jgi:hypothetical protein
MPSKWPATGFWLFRLDQVDGRTAITEKIWCGPERPDKAALENADPRPLTDSADAPTFSIPVPVRRSVRDATD